MEGNRATCYTPQGEGGGKDATASGLCDNGRRNVSRTILQGWKRTMHHDQAGGG